MKKEYVMRKILCLFLLCLCFSSCSKENKALESDLYLFKDKIENSDSYIYSHKIHGVDKDCYWFFQKELTLSINKVNELMEIEFREKDNDNWSEDSHIVGKKDNKIYTIMKNYVGSSSNDLMYYKCEYEGFSDKFNKYFDINFDARTSYYNIKKEIEVEEKHYVVKYNLSDFMEVYNDDLVIELADRINVAKKEAFVLIEYTFTDSIMIINYLFDFDGIDNDIAMGPYISIEIKIDICDVELDYKKDTLVVELEDLNSPYINDITGFNSFRGTLRNDGCVKVYLEEGIYEVSSLMYNFDYEIYDSNKQMLDKADSYILNEGYYYIFVHMDFGGIVTINKLG